MLQISSLKFTIIFNNKIIWRYKMKKITLLLFTMLSLLSYSAKTVDYQEVDKYIRQKLDKDKEITFVYKLNSADNTLEGYSDEEKLTS